MQTVLHILNEEISVECSAVERRRLEDLGAALEARLSGFGGDPAGLRCLALTALALMDEVQTTNAALVRARCEIERLTDMIAEARIEDPAASDAVAINPDRGCVQALRSGAA